MDITKISGFSQGIDLALRDVGLSSPLRVMRLEYWDFYRGSFGKSLPRRVSGYALEHAAVIETSLMLHYHPDLVRLDLIPDDQPAVFPPYDVFPPHQSGYRFQGTIFCKRATVAKGILMATQVVDRIAAAVKHEFQE
jgi:creatinine amidohydrolase